MFDNPKAHIKLFKSISYGRITPRALLSTFTKNEHHFSIYLFLCQEWLSTQRPHLLHPHSLIPTIIFFKEHSFYIFLLFFYKVQTPLLVSFVTRSATKVISLSDDSIEAISSLKDYPLNLKILQTMKGYINMW